MIDSVVNRIRIHSRSYSAINSEEKINRGKKTNNLILYLIVLKMNDPSEDKR